MQAFPRESPLEHNSKLPIVEIVLYCYFVTEVTLDQDHRNVTTRTIKRTQTGVRIETSLLKVLKGLAEYTDLSLGDLLEGIVLHSFEGKAPFATETLRAIEQLKQVYGCDLTAADSHTLKETAT
jgi:hypothetical protein